MYKNFQTHTITIYYKKGWEKNTNSHVLKGVASHSLSIFGSPLGKFIYFCVIIIIRSHIHTHSVKETQL